MQKIITATGLEFNVIWCGLSTIDHVLRFEIKGSTMQTVLETFTDSQETATLTQIFDELETVYTGYTLFVGVDMNRRGSIIVSLMEETT